MKSKDFVIYCDGGARGNPGPAGSGAVIYDRDNNLLAEISEYLGKTTNNQAEYRAVLAAIRKAKELEGESLQFYLDSELIVKQMSGEYRVKNQDLLPLFMEIRKLTLGFKNVHFSHVPREQNKQADLLANQAMDRGE